jgi:hypothetical protein
MFIKPPPLPKNPTTVPSLDLYGKPDTMVQEPWAWALVVVTVVNAGLIEWFHRCGADDCSTAFFGDPRSRWCSTRCGARMRQAKYRKDTKPKAKRRK